MIKKFKELYNRLEKADHQLSNFLESSIAPGTISKLKPFIGEFNKLKKSAVEFEELMIPVEPIEVHWPFDDDELRPTWDYWKNYLTQQYGIRYGTYAEQEALEYLHRLHDGDNELAKQSLKYSMANLYSKFFKLNENETAKTNKSKASTPTKTGDTNSANSLHDDRGPDMDLGDVHKYV